MPTFRNTLFHLHRPMKMEQSAPKRRHIKLRLRGIIQKKAYNFSICVTWKCVSMGMGVCVLRNWLVALSKPFAETSPFLPDNTDPVKGNCWTRLCLLVHLFVWFVHTKSTVCSTPSCKFEQTILRSAHDSRVDPYMGQQELWEGQKILALLKLIASNEYPELVKMIASPNILADALLQIRGERWLAGEGRLLP